MGEVFAATVDVSYSLLTVVMGTSVWGVVGLRSFLDREDDTVLLTLLPCISVNQCLRHNSGYKQKIIQIIRRNQVYFSTSNVSTDTTVIVKD